MTVRIGNYIIYPAFFILIFAIFISIMIIMLAIHFIKERKEEHANDDSFKITEWQRKYVIRLCRDYMRDNEVSDEYEESINKLEKFILESTYWNLDELLEIDKNLVKNASLVLFFAAQDSYLLQQEDDAVLLLHTIDMMNGGPDNPDYFGGDYPWIGDEVQEMKNHKDMTDEEARTLYMWFSAVGDIASFVDEDLGKIPEASSAPQYCKRISQEEMETCAQDLLEIVDIRALKPENRDIVCKAMFCNILIMLNGIFMNRKEEDNNTEEEILYIDEFRRYSIRSLTAAIDNQLYSDVIASIDV